MFCSHCGSQVEEGARFCQNCGASVDVTKREEKMTYEPIDLTSTIEEKAKDELAGSILTNAIVSLAINFGSGTLLALIGTIIAGVARGKAGEYERKYGALEGKAKVGKILANVGFFAGIGFTVFWALYIFIIVMAVLATV